MTLFLILNSCEQDFQDIEDFGIEKVIGMGCWSNRKNFGLNLPDSKCKKVALEMATFWNAEFEGEKGSEFQLVKYEKKSGAVVKTEGLVKWSQNGNHNVKNALAAVAAANHVGVDLFVAVKALENFEGVKRRMELRGTVRGIKVYDDFAHHPTAIANTLDALPKEGTPLIAVIELRSNTMKAGVHGEALLASSACADFVYWVLPETTTWDVGLLLRADGTSVVVRDMLALETQLVKQASGQIIFMSNGGFSGIQSRLVARLTEC